MLLVFVLFGLVMAMPKTAHAMYFDNYFGTGVIPDLCYDYDWSYCTGYANAMNSASLEAAGLADSVSSTPRPSSEWNGVYLTQLKSLMTYGYAYPGDGGLCYMNPNSLPYGADEMYDFCILLGQHRAYLATDGNIGNFPYS